MAMRQSAGRAIKRKALRNRWTSVRILACGAEVPLYVLTSAGRVKCTDHHLCHVLRPIQVFFVHPSQAAKVTVFYIALNSYYLFLVASIHRHDGPRM